MFRAVSLFVCLLLPFVLQAKPKLGAIATAHPIATEAGFEVLAAGGNAFDAAVAISATLAVVEPSGSGIGGGGFWLLHRASDNKQIFVDGREKAPLAATETMYLDAAGNVIPKASLDGALAAGIPGEPAALAHIAERYGALPLSQSLQPAIRAAAEGFPADGHMIKRLAFRQKVMSDNPAADVFLPNGDLPAEGVVIHQADLAQTLRLLAKHGRDGFYKGELAEKLVSGVKAAGGIWTLKDLAEYQVIEREPVRGHYRGYEIISAPPPSSGGVAMLETLNILRFYDLDNADPVTRTHLIIEAMRRAYRDRAQYLGDSDFVPVPVDRLTSVQHAAEWVPELSTRRATPSADLPAVTVEEVAGTDTTHFSVVDAEGNRVSATLSINFPFGSGFMPAGTGVLLNNEMDDFSKKPGEPNGYGLVHGRANSIAPGKRMLSSMTPTFVEKGDSVAVVGTPGGSRIISMVLLGALEYMHDGWGKGTDASSVVATPRYHHQYLPDVVSYEKGGLEHSMLQGLAVLGHKTKERGRRYGNMHVVLQNAEGMTAASDPRGIGQADVR
ncbi:MAG: gamma-glutamyltransferase [Gammaproteobacteria bacterium]|nr:gamma-glutamyltransferase [Gammaproteobacteria bacterium]